MGIEIRSLTRRFRDGTRALEGVDLDVAEGELLVLVGPSGSGKTTLLRLVAGLDQPTAGTIRLGGKDLAGVPPHRRNVALVFQNLALYSHLSVAENLAFGLKNERSNERGSGERIAETAKLLGIEPLMQRLPAELSGGEQQRVALGRAMVRQPAALLLDEPLSSLDAPVRRTLRRELKSVQRRLGVPTIYVTHDQAEALALGDRIAVLDRGQLQQVASPHDVYHRPANRFVAEFFGPQGMNFISDPRSRLNIETGTKVICGFRPEDAAIAAGNGDGLCGTVESCEQLGDVTYAQVRLDNSIVTIKLPHNLPPPKLNESLSITIDPTRLHWFDSTTGNRMPKA